MRKSLSHTVWEFKCHVVWVPKKRRKIVYGKRRKEIGEILRRLSEYKGIDVIEGKACMYKSYPCVNGIVPVEECKKCRCTSKFLFTECLCKVYIVFP